MSVHNLPIGRLAQRALFSGMIEEVRYRMDAPDCLMLGRWSGTWYLVTSEQDFWRIREAEQKAALSLRGRLRSLGKRLRWKPSVPLDRPEQPLHTLEEIS